MIARRLILVLVALLGPLPSPLPGNRAMKVTLDLGPAWTALAARLGTDDPQTIAGYARAILARGRIEQEK